MHSDARAHTFRRPSSMTVSGFALVLVLAAVAAGCTKTYSANERSGQDQGRTGAQTIPMDAAVTDAVNLAGGDATDWKQFQATEPGTTTVEVYFDARYIDADVTLYDSYGTQLERVSRTNQTEASVITYDLPEDGLYFVRIQANGGRSVYSIRVYPGSPAERSGETDPRPELDRPI